MEVLILLVVVSLSLGAGAVLLFARSIRDRSHEHAERLAILPLEPDEER